jgi:1,4-dihydroxy-2-naphthoate octaprenyltransferase
MMNNAKIYLLAARPKTLPAAAAPVVIGGAMAYAEGGFSLWVFLATVAAAVLIQVGTNFANDYYDYVKGADTTDRTGPRRATQAGLVTPSQMKRAFIIAFAAAVGVGGYLVYIGGLPIAAIGVLSIICGILYTAGPWPLGYTGLADLFVLAFFGPVAVGGTYYLQTGSINAAVIVAGLAPGLFSTAILTVNNLRDIETDRPAGKKTLAVRFGRRFAVGEYLLTMTAACVVPVVLCVGPLAIRQGNLPMLATLTIIPAALLIKKLTSNPTADEYNKILANTGKVLALFALIFAVTWIL